MLGRNNSIGFRKCIVKYYLVIIWIVNNFCLAKKGAIFGPFLDEVPPILTEPVRPNHVFG